jgi:hypothetical protein
MVTTTPKSAAIHGTRMPESVVVVYARAWKQRPASVVLGGFRTDNSTGVSAVEHRHR